MFFSAIIPIKSHSQRLNGKNFRLFHGKPLFFYIIDTLCSIEAINQVIIDTDCPEKLQSLEDLFGPKLNLLPRPQALHGDHIVMNQLLTHSLGHAKNQHIIQSHVTNPLLERVSVLKAIDAYKSGLHTYDSLFSVTRHQKRFFDQNGGPLNHNPAVMQPTQDLPPVFEENSNLFIFSKESFAAGNSNRVGQRPQMFELNRIEAIDIDYLEDFRMAELGFSMAGKAF